MTRQPVNDRSELLPEALGRAASTPSTPAALASTSSRGEGDAYVDAARHSARVGDEAPRPFLPADQQVALLRTLADKLPAMLAYWDVDLRCRFANRDYEKWFGVKPEALIGLHLKELLGPLFALNWPHIQGALRGEKQEFEREIPDPAGGPPRFSQAHYIPDIVDGKVRGFCVLVADITRRKRAEEALVTVERQLQAAERLAAMATLSAGIGHEINNPLGALLANVELMTENLESARPDPTILRGGLAEVRDAAKRIQDIVGSMKLLARGDTGTRGLVDVAETVEQSIGFSSNVIRYRARVVRDIQNVGSVLGNAPQLAQVIVNLLANAAQALPNDHVERNEIRVSARREGGQVVIEVGDNGCGIPDNLQARIFEPFFTTKDVGEGTGLGLSISSSIVHAFGGEITVRSKVGEGSVFRVELPAAAQAAPETAVPPPLTREAASPASARARRSRLLVVDDEVALTRILQRLLGEENEVVTVNHGRDALELLSAGQPEFDLILCDLMMPEMGGAEVYAGATARRPELAERFVFMTGGAFTPRGRQFLESERAPVLDKPIDVDQLRALVRERTRPVG